MEAVAYGAAFLVAAYAAGEDIPVHSEEQNGKVVTWRWIIDAPPIPLFAKYGSFKGNVSFCDGSVR